MMRRILVAFLAALLLALTCACGPKRESGLGIIGGADGPTAIFIAGETS